MKRLLLSALCLLCFLVCGVFISQNDFAKAMEPTNLTDSIGVESDMNNAGGYSLHTSFETFTYETDDIIPVTFILESDSPVLSISFDYEGFRVISSPVLATSSSINAQITYDNSTDTPLFTVYVELEMGYFLKARVYGTVEEGRLYVNGSSFAAAKDIYFSHKLKNGSMSQKQ